MPVTRDVSRRRRTPRSGRFLCFRSRFFLCFAVAQLCFVVAQLCFELFSFRTGRPPLLCVLDSRGGCLGGLFSKALLPCAGRLLFWCLCSRRVHTELHPVPRMLELVVVVNDTPHVHDKIRGHEPGSGGDCEVEPNLCLVDKL